MIGSTIGHYAILEKLGEGGMGVVYKATDTKLNRAVALKFLPPSVNSDPSAAARFHQEAQAAAGLNHPNICTIHGIEEAGSQHFIVMEFVDGQTLQLKKGSLSRKQALDVGIQIAEGLAAAHEKGIVHRDIKPENIMIRKDGIAQVMDFGLAKLRGASRLTKEGSTVGTAGYMSPEQVQGQDTDHRTDIFSLGVLLYEMLTGQPPFKGVHETAIAYEIVNVDPLPLSSFSPEISPELDALVLQCLEKDPDERTQSAKQVAVDLNRQRRESGRQRTSRLTTARSLATGQAPAVQEGEPRHRARRAFVWQALSALFLTSTIVSVLIPWNSETTPRSQVVRMVVEPPGSATGTSRSSSVHGEPVVSSDGRTIAFSAQEGSGSALFIRRTDRFETDRVDGGGRRPFFSPDGQWIGFLRDATVWKVPADGGEATRVGDIPEVIWNIVGQGWHPDGRILILGGTGIWALSSSGGDATLLFSADTVSGQILGGMSVSEDGTILLAVYRRPSSTRGAKGGLMIVSADGLTTKDLPSAIEPPARIIEDVIVYLQAGQVKASYIDAQKGTLRGEPVSLTGLPKPRDLEEQDWLAPFLVGLGRSAVWTYGEAWELEPVWVSRAGSAVPTGIPAEVFRWPRLSPDGRRLAVKSSDERLYAVDLRTLSRVQLGDIDHTEPVWSPDGRAIVYSGAGMGAGLQISGLLQQVSDARRPPDTLLAATMRETWPTSYSPDGKQVAFYGTASGDRNDIFVLDIPSRAVKHFPMPGTQRAARFSPNGRWLAYQSDETGTVQIYVRPWPEMNPKSLVSPGGGEEPVWSHDGRELYFRLGNAIMAAAISQESGFRASRPVELFRGPYPRDRWGDQSFDVAPDGRFLMLRAVDHNRVQAFVVLNWIEEVKETLARANN